MPQASRNLKRCTKFEGFGLEALAYSLASRIYPRSNEVGGSIASRHDAQQFPEPNAP